MPLLFQKNHQFEDANGRPLNGGSLTFYLTGTTTPIATYNSSAYSVANSNPVTLNSAGRPHLSGTLIQIWAQNPSRVRCIVKDSAGVTISDDDPLSDAIAPLVIVAVDDGSATDLRSTEGAVNGQIATTRGYWSAGDGGAASYYWDSASTSTHNGFTVISVSGVTTGRWKLIWDGSTASARLAGAKFDASTDDTAALQAFHDALLSTGGVMELPVGTAIVTENGTNNYCLLFTKPMSIRGAGMLYSAIKPHAGVDSACNIIEYRPASGVTHYGTTYGHFYVGDPSTGTRTGNNGIYVNTQTVAADVAKFVMDRVGVASGAGRGFLHLNDAAVNTNGGIYSSRITNCVIKDGLKFDLSGDSITVDNNLLSGDGVGCEVSLVGTGSGQAMNFIFQQNNVTNTGGGFLANSGNRIKVLYNFFEFVTVSGLSNNALIDFNGGVNTMYNCEFSGNTVGPFTGLALDMDLRIRSCVGMKVEDNFFGAAAAGDYAIDIATSTDTVIGRNQYVAGFTTEINDAGTGTRGFLKTPTLLNSWVNYDTVNYKSASFYKDMEGNVHIFGSIKDGTATSGTDLFVLPVGFRPSHAHVFQCPNDNAGTFGSTQVQVTADGVVELVGNAAGNTRLSLDGIKFPANNSASVTFPPGWIGDN